MEWHQLGWVGGSFCWDLAEAGKCGLEKLVSVSHATNTAQGGVDPSVSRNDGTDVVKGLLRLESQILFIQTVGRVGGF